MTRALSLVRLLAGIATLTLFLVACEIVDPVGKTDVHHVVTVDGAPLPLTIVESFDRLLGRDRYRTFVHRN